MDWREYLSNPQYLADNMARKDFGEKLMLAFKQKNLSEGIQWYQAEWLHHRMRAWEVTLPPALGSAVLTVDIINQIYSGDIETATLALTYGSPDDMSSPLHWMNAERLGWIVDQTKAWLGWA
jgi:hypothetical protein